MNTEADFLAALRATPGDQLLLSAFADFLEENGDHRAAWVRDDAVRPWMGPDFADPLPALIDAVRRGRRGKSARDAFARVGRAAVNPLLSLLADAAPEVRRRAGRALVGVRRFARRDLLRRAREDSAACRVAALRGLVMVRSRRAADVLGRALDDADPAVRLGAAEAAGGLVPPSLSVPLLLRAAGDGDAVVRRAAVSTLSCRQASDSAEAQLAVPVWSRDPDPAVRAAAVGRFSKMLMPAEIVAMLSDPVATVRAEAAGALATVPRVESALLAATEDGDAAVVLAALRSLAGRPSLPADAEPVLLQLVERGRSGEWSDDAPAPWTRAAVSACGGCPSPSAALVASLADLLASERFDSEAAHALGRLGPPALPAVGRLLALARTAEIHAAQRAFEAVLRIGDPVGLAALMGVVRGRPDGQELLSILAHNRHSLPLTGDDAEYLLGIIEGPTQDDKLLEGVLSALYRHPEHLTPHRTRLTALAASPEVPPEARARVAFLLRRMPRAVTDMEEG